MAGTDGREPLSETVQFFVPLPEAHRMLVLAFSTPMLQLADAYAPLFDAMAESARWRAEATAAGVGGGREP